MKMNKKGFTLAELLIVVAIIAVLVAVAIPVFTTQLEKSREATDAANLRSAYAEAMTKVLTAKDGDTVESEVYNVQQTGSGWLDAETDDLSKTEIANLPQGLQKAANVDLTALANKKFAVVCQLSGDDVYVGLGAVTPSTSGDGSYEVATGSTAFYRTSDGKAKGA